MLLALAPSMVLIGLIPLIVIAHQRDNSALCVSISRMASAMRARSPCEPYECDQAGYNDQTAVNGPPCLRSQPSSMASTEPNDARS